MAARVRFRALELFNNSVWYLLAFLERNVRKTLEQLLLQRGASWTFWCPHQRWPYFQQSEHAGIGSRKEGSARLSSLSPLSIMRKENTLRPARDCVFNNMTWPVSQKTGPMGNVTRTKKALSWYLLFKVARCRDSRSQFGELLFPSQCSEAQYRGFLNLWWNTWNIWMMVVLLHPLV